MNVLAGVVASKIFVYNNGLLTARIGYCLIALIIFKMLPKRAAVRFIKNQFMHFFNDPGSEPAIPAGIRRVEYF